MCCPYEFDIIELIDRHVIVEWNKYLGTYDLDFLRYNGHVDNEFVFKGVKTHRGTGKAGAIIYPSAEADGKRSSQK